MAHLVSLERFHSQSEILFVHNLTSYVFWVFRRGKSPALELEKYLEEVR